MILRIAEDYSVSASIYQNIHPSYIQQNGNLYLFKDIGFHVNLWDTWKIRSPRLRNNACFSVLDDEICCCLAALAPVPSPGACLGVLLCFKSGIKQILLFLFQLDYILYYKDHLHIHKCLFRGFVLRLMNVNLPVL